MKVLIAGRLFCVKSQFGSGILSGPAITSLVLSALMLLPGCSGPVELQSGRERASDRSWPSFVARGGPATCPLRCKPTAVTFLRAGLGLDPTEGSEANLGTEMILTTLCSAGSTQDAQIERVTLADCLKSLPIGPSDPVVLVHQNGHLYLLLGILQIDGQRICQIIHGESPVWLVTPSQLQNAGFRDVWKFRRMSETFPIRIGAAQVRVHKLFHNFGEVKPHSRTSCRFVIENTGERTVVLDKPKMSCGCITPKTTAVTPLAPGEHHELLVTLETGVSSSIRHTVLLKCFEKQTGTSGQLVLCLFGSQRESMLVVPGALDFGLVVPGKTYSRTVRLSEVATDRFVVKSVDAGDLSVRHRIEATKDQYGLDTYLVRLKLNAPHEISSGKRIGTLVINTDSRICPQVRIPVVFEVEPFVRAVPSVVSLGSLSVGEHRQAKVRLVSRNAEPFAVDVVTCPKDCSVQLTGNRDRPEMIVTATVKNPGIWCRTIVVKTRVNRRVQSLSIRCVGYAQGKL